MLDSDDLRIGEKAARVFLVEFNARELRDILDNHPNIWD